MAKGEGRRATPSPRDVPSNRSGAGRAGIDPESAAENRVTAGAGEGIRTLDPNLGNRPEAISLRNQITRYWSVRCGHRLLNLHCSNPVRNLLFTTRTGNGRVGKEGVSTCK